jgi:hypothetical protein
MKLYTQDQTILMDITAVRPHAAGVVIEGKIMGTIPMKAVLRPEELRAGFRLLTPGLLVRLVAMLFRKSAKTKSAPTGRSAK